MASGGLGPRVADAFALTADTSAYVPRLALEAALAELSEGIGKTPARAALSGEAGLGKTLLLHVLRERLAGAFVCLYVPFPRLAAPELWRWIAADLGLGSDHDDRGAVLGRAGALHEDGSGLVLLVDDAGALPPPTLRDLLAASETPGLSLVLAFHSEDHAQLATLPPDVRRVDLGPPMTLAETRAYVHARLRRADPSGALVARLGPDRLAALHDASGGVPARLHALLDAWLRTPGEQSAASEPEPEPNPGAVEERAAETAPVAAAPEAPRAFTLPQLERLAAILRSPRFRVAVFALFALATATAWLLALQQGPGAPSVGVPVPRFEPPPPVVAPAPEPERLAPAPPPLEAPAAPAAEPEAPGAPPEEAAPEEPALKAPPPASHEAASAAPSLAATRPPARPLAPPLPVTPPPPDPSRPEPPEHVTRPPFADEHVPPTLESAPLGPPPAGPRLSVNARPWAEIHLDGQPLGETPLGELPVAPGSHVVSATLPDGRVVERNVEAQGGDVYVVFP